MYSTTSTTCSGVLHMVTKCGIHKAIQLLVHIMAAGHMIHNVVIQKMEVVHFFFTMLRQKYVALMAESFLIIHNANYTFNFQASDWSKIESHFSVKNIKRKRK